MASAVSADRVRVRVFRGLLRARAPRVRSHVRFITIPVPVFTLNKQNSYLTESNTVYRTTGTQEKRVPSPRPLGPYSKIQREAYPQGALEASAVEVRVDGETDTEHAREGDSEEKRQRVLTCVPSEY